LVVVGVVVVVLGGWWGSHLEKAVLLQVEETTARDVALPFSNQKTPSSSLQESGLRNVVYKYTLASFSYLNEQRFNYQMMTVSYGAVMAQSD
jgi:hypothetical protein